MEIQEIQDLKAMMDLKAHQVIKDQKGHQEMMLYFQIHLVQLHQQTLNILSMIIMMFLKMKCLMSEQ